MTHWELATTETKPEVFGPGEILDDGRLDTGEYGVAISAETLLYGTLPDVRAYLEQALAALPKPRDGQPLIVVDRDRQWAWIGTDAQLYDDDGDPDGDPWMPTEESVHELVDQVIANPGAAGWTLGDGVKSLFTEDDEEGGLMVGVELTSGLRIGLGDPIRDEAFTQPWNPLPPQADDHHLAMDALDQVADRINNSY